MPPVTIREEITLRFFWKHPDEPSNCAVLRQMCVVCLVVLLWFPFEAMKGMLAHVFCKYLVRRHPGASIVAVLFRHHNCPRSFVVGFRAEKSSAVVSCSFLTEASLQSVSKETSAQKVQTLRTPAQTSANKVQTSATVLQIQNILWMDEFLHHLRIPGIIRFPFKNQQIMVSHGFKVVQDFVHPQYGTADGFRWTCLLTTRRILVKYRTCFEAEFNVSQCSQLPL